MEWGRYGRSSELEELGEFLGRGRRFFARVTGRSRIGKMAVEDVIILRAGARPLDGDAIEADLDAHDDCVRDPREWSGRWSFIVYGAAEARARILEKLTTSPGERVTGGFVSATEDGALCFTLTYANAENLRILRRIIQQIMDEYGPRIFDLEGRELTERCGERVDGLFPSLEGST